MPEKRIIKLIHPVQVSPSHYENKAIGLYIGISDSTDTLDYASPYPHDEFIFIMEGAVKVQNNQTGCIESLVAGDSFVIPNGYDYCWHQQGYLRKLYVKLEEPTIYEKPNIEKVIYIDKSSDVPWKDTSDGHRKKMLYQNHNQLFTSGVWQGKALNTNMIEFPYHEFILIDNGKLTCTDEMGVTHNFNCGDALFIPQGTPCSWNVKDEVSIHFVQIKSTTNQ